MTTPITTPEEMLEMVLWDLRRMRSAKAPQGVRYRALDQAVQTVEALRSRIAPPAPLHEELRERIKDVWKLPWHAFKTPRPNQVTEEIIPPLHDCLAALEPADPQPTADDVVRAVREAIAANPDRIPVYWPAAERAIRAVFAARAAEEK